MFSGCKDEQTSADATISGKHVGYDLHHFQHSVTSADDRQSDELGIPANNERRSKLAIFIR